MILWLFIYLIINELIVVLKVKKCLGVSVSGENKIKWKVLHFWYKNFGIIFDFVKNKLLRCFV